MVVNEILVSWTENNKADAEMYLSYLLERRTEMKISKDNWRKFARRIVEKGNKISVKDAKECGIPTGYFIEMCMRGLSEEQLVNNAKKLLERLGEQND